MALERRPRRPAEAGPATADLSLFRLATLERPGGCAALGWAYLTIDGEAAGAVATIGLCERELVEMACWSVRPPRPSRLEDMIFYVACLTGGHFRATDREDLADVARRVLAGKRGEAGR